MAPSVVIIGASDDRSKYGNKSLRAHVDAGYTVYPVNPKGGEIEGIPVYRHLSEIPQRRIDRVSMYVPASIGIELLAEIAELDLGELWLNPGSESPELLQRAQQLGLEPIQACSLIDARARSL